MQLRPLFFSILCTLLIIPASKSAAQTPIRLNFGNTATVEGWNNLGSANSSSPVSLLDSNGLATNVTMTRSNWTGSGSNGVRGADLPDGKPLSASISDYYYYQASGTSGLTFSGLDNSTLYKVEIFSARDGTNDLYITYVCNGSNLLGQVNDNLNNWVTFTSVAPSNGNISISFTHDGSNNAYNYVNAIIITPIEGNVQQYALTTEGLPANMGSVSPPGGTYNEGSQVYLNPQPETGHVFSHWSGDASGNAEPLLVNMTGPKHIVANFVEDTQPSYSISINPSPANGSISISPAGPYAAGTPVTVTANPDPGYVFQSWGGGFSARTSSSFTFNISADYTVTASFEAEGGGGGTAWNETMGNVVQTSKSVNIGTSTSNTDAQGNTYLLSVDGMARATKIVIESSVAWPDYVFEAGYELRSLEELQAFIDAQGHLPEVPSASQVESQGISIGDMDAALLRKVEELTLYILEQNKTIEAQNQVLESLQREIQEIKGNTQD